MSMRGWLAGAGMALAMAGVCRGQVLGTSTIVAEDPMMGGRVQVVSTVIDLPATGREGARYRYEVTNLTYAPDPALTNALSGLEFGGYLPAEPVDLAASPGWTSAIRDHVYAEYTIPFGAGVGLAPGETAVFEFTGDERFAPWIYYFEPYGPRAFTHDAVGPTGAFLLHDVQTGLGPLIPTPAPSAIGLCLVAGGSSLARRRRASIGCGSMLGRSSGR